MLIRIVQTETYICKECNAKSNGELKTIRRSDITLLASPARSPPPVSPTATPSAQTKKGRGRGTTGRGKGGRKNATNSSTNAGEQVQVEGEGGETKMDPLDPALPLNLDEQEEQEEKRWKSDPESDDKESDSESEGSVYGGENAGRANGDDDDETGARGKGRGKKRKMSVQDDEDDSASEGEVNCSSDTVGRVSASLSLTLRRLYRNRSRLLNRRGNKPSGPEAVQQLSSNEDDPPRHPSTRLLPNRRPLGEKARGPVLMPFRLRQERVRVKSRVQEVWARSGLSSWTSSRLDSRRSL
jgi:hypothetical protein